MAEIELSVLKGNDLADRIPSKEVLITQRRGSIDAIVQRFQSSPFPSSPKKPYLYTTIKNDAATAHRRTELCQTAKIEHALRRQD